MSPHSCLVKKKLENVTMISKNLILTLIALTGIHKSSYNFLVNLKDLGYKVLKTYLLKQVI